MRATSAFLRTLVSLAGASPLLPRQDINFSLVDSAPDPTSASIPIGPAADVVTYDLPAATLAATETPLPVEAFEKRHLAARTACEPQPTGAGPVPSPDTDDAFVHFGYFSTVSTIAPVPAGYNLSFFNLHASNIAYGYLGYTTLDSYNTEACARQCDSITGCSGVNIYFERDPSVEPGPGCENPPSTTVIKCVFWGGNVVAENAKNDGQWRSDFHVVIAGSNGYMKTAIPPVPGFNGEPLGSLTIDATVDCNGKNTYIGSKIFTTSVFDPNLCAAACTSQNEYDLLHLLTGEPMICRFFTTYLMAKNGNPEGQYCTLYTQYWNSSYATNDGQWRGEDHYTVGYAFSYVNATSSGIPTCSTNESGGSSTVGLNVSVGLQGGVSTGQVTKIL
ncbi:hypothetical protein F4779DRAFT_638391 [Xylariaceae sp. FL0662B]|nr:hypothetical protein F4779DRAFT_638391 [Xylariaceae sp. FL0662B]